MNYQPPKYHGPSYAQRLPDALLKTTRVKPLVACVYWGDKYPRDYVRKLRIAVERNLEQPHDFVCVTHDTTVDADCICPAVEFEGWWQKVGLFPDGVLSAAHRPVLYLDLDVVVTGRLDAFLAFEVPQGGLLMVENFGPNKPHCAHNSSVMVWISNTLDDVAQGFKPEYMKHLHGDQCYLWRAKDGRIDNFPRDLARSYKYDCTRGLPQDARVIVFHGKPDPHEVRDPWVAKHWGSL